MAIWDFLLKLNGTDSETFGIYVESLRGPWDTPEFLFDSQQVAERDGPVLTVTTPDLAAKQFVISATIEDPSGSESTFEGLIDAAKYQLSRSDLAIIVGNRDTRQRRGRLVSLVGVPYDGPVTAVHAEITIECVDPIARETSNSTVSGSASTDRDIALGTWRSSPVITHTSPTSPLVETYKDSSGATKGSLTITFPGSPTTIVVDHGNRTITVDSVRHDEYLTAGDFFAFDPRHGDRDTNLPTIAWDSGTAVASYAKAWL